jgi:hypothetical protein
LGSSCDAAPAACCATKYFGASRKVSDAETQNLREDRSAARAKAKSWARAGTPRHQQTKTPRENRKLSAPEAPTQVLALYTATYQRPEYSQHEVQRRALLPNTKLTGGYGVFRSDEQKGSRPVQRLVVLQFNAV